VGRERRFHRSKRGVSRGAWARACIALAGLALPPACNRDPQITTRTVTVHAPKSCIDAQTPLDGQAYVEFDALGDFDPPAQPAGGHLLGALGAQLTEIDDDAQVLAVEATEADREWQGVGDVAATGNVDVLVTPTLTSCALTSPATATGSRSGATLAPFGGRQVLLVGGVPLPKLNLGPPPTYVANLNTGAIVQATPDLLVPRTGATVTAFGSGALVAGGIDPQSQGSVQATAEVFDAALGGFDQQSPIMLSEPRADAGAVVLATGETLLVGGVGADGTSVLASMEIVDPATRTVRTANVAQLSVARSAPTVLLLASGQILVVGGVDGSGNPVNTLEWFRADVSQASQLPSQLVTGQAQSAVALEGGGALVVMAPPANAGATFNDVWMIDADGAVEAAQPIEGALTQPVLFGGAGGAPLLWTGDRWLRWQPWQGSFGDADVLDSTPASVSEVVASPDSGLAFWLDATDLALTGLRFDSQGEYSALPGALLAGDDGETAPDRLPSPGVVTFDPSTGVTLASGASVFVTDRTYADVTIDVDQPTGEPVLVVLRDQTGTELEVGGETCPGALTGSTAGQASTLHVQRTGTAVTWNLGGGAPVTCATGIADAARLSIGLRGPENAAEGVAANLIIARVSAP
jgi:hypothetical protein